MSAPKNQAEEAAINEELRKGGSDGFGLWPTEADTLRSQLASAQAELEVARGRIGKLEETLKAIAAVGEPGAILQYTSTPLSTLINMASAALLPAGEGRGE